MDKCSCSKCCWKGVFECVGTSPIFDEIKEGCEAPEYTIILSLDDENGISVSAKKL